MRKIVSDLRSAAYFVLNEPILLFCQISFKDLEHMLLTLHPHLQEPIRLMFLLIALLILKNQMSFEEKD